MTTLAKPAIKGFPTDPSTGKVGISLSAIKDGSGLIVTITDGQQISPYDSAFLMLGSDRENPEWKSSWAERAEMGEGGGPEEDPKLKTGVTLTLPKQYLTTYKDKEVQLRYVTRGESGLNNFSEPITLKVQ
ncbi:hypothetical protein [Pseudomonas sp. OA65]|uniref:hypothetical protein n=1 Tax=Pseudomonas sp. OA65 TaxID=2818431 RepID=UPI001A9F7D1D|nr:hypothetical protein [Pseudomonas sp. OA65]MBO1537687.1 hypothetical protein [Pseudomonas sp. OA65]